MLQRLEPQVTHTKSDLARVLIAGWLVLVMKCFLPALLIYFLAVKPLIGTGYGLNYTFFYLAIFCPTATVLLFQKFQKKRQAQGKTT